MAEVEFLLIRLAKLARRSSTAKTYKQKTCFISKTYKPMIRETDIA